LLVEDSAVLAFEGEPLAPRWLASDVANGLLTARPTANVALDLASDFVGEVVSARAHWSDALDDAARGRAAEVLDAHTRVRRAASERGIRFRAEPQLPADVLGVYVLLPEVKR
jgi:hypothetical protein